MMALVRISLKSDSTEGEVLLDGKGSADISRPSLFRWKTSAPDETLLVSDGKMFGITVHLSSK